MKSNKIYSDEYLKAFEMISFIRSRNYNYIKNINEYNRTKEALSPVWVRMPEGENCLALNLFEIITKLYWDATRINSHNKIT